MVHYKEDNWKWVTRKFSALYVDDPLLTIVTARKNDFDLFGVLTEFKHDLDLGCVFNGFLLP